MQCDLTNNASLISTAQNDLNNIPTTGNSTFDNYITAARNAFSSIQSYYTDARNDAAALTNPLTVPSTSVQNVLYYSFLLQFNMGYGGGSITDAGHAVGEIIADVQSGTAYSLSFDMNILDNLTQADAFTRNADAQVEVAELCGTQSCMTADGTLISRETNPLQQAVLWLLEPTNNVPYRLGTDEDLIGDAGFQSGGTIDEHLSNTANYIGSGWRGSDGAAYAILDSLLTGCTN